MSLSRVAVLRGIFAWRGRRDRERARRWSEIAQLHPDVVDDIATLGGVLQVPHEIPPDPSDPQPVDPCRLAFEAGQRDLAVKLISLMGITNYELDQLMEASE
ncbi:hypothetical protein [Shimia sp.]|uniref:hypothetical protein n=1 Tax=Shimia sp. TaxID=1954381 RepID=UPI003BAC9E53